MAGFLVLTLGGRVVAAGGVHADPFQPPPFFAQLAADPEPYAILELPLFTDQGQHEVHYQAYQTVHHKWRFSGHWSRDHALDNPNNFVKRASLFRQFWLLAAPAAAQDLAYPDQDFLQRTDYATQGIPILNYYHARYIVVYKDAIPPENWPAYQALIAQVLGAGAAPVYEDTGMRAYAVPQGAPAARPLTLDVGAGWYEREVGADGRISRWAHTTPDQPAELYSMNLTDHPVTGTLRFTVYPYNQARTLEVAVNGTPVTTLQLRPEAGPQAVALDLPLPAGNNLLTFRSPTPPIPTDHPRQDSRLLSFGMYGVALTAK